MAAAEWREKQPAHKPLKITVPQVACHKGREYGELGMATNGARPTSPIICQRVIRRVFIIPLNACQWNNPEMCQTKRARRNLVRSRRAENTETRPLVRRWKALIPLADPQAGTPSGFDHPDSPTSPARPEGKRNGPTAAASFPAVSDPARRFRGQLPPRCQRPGQ
jgi:hypothetical protein